MTYLSVPADTSHEPPEGDDFLLVNHVLEVSDGAVQGHALDGLSCLAGGLDWMERLAIRIQIQC